MIISAIGDSLTEGDYGVFGKRGIANVHEENYPYFLAQLTGCEVRNFGACGRTATTYLDNRYRAGLVDVTGSDLILVMLGTNGGFDDSCETQCNQDFDTLLTLLHKDAPNAKIVLCTPPRATENPKFSNFGYADRVITAVRFIRKYAKEHNYELIDVFACGLFTEENEHILQANDGLHFVKEGYFTLAKWIAKELGLLKKEQ